MIRRRWTLSPGREARDAGADSGSEGEEEAETEAEAEAASSAQSNGKGTAAMAVVLDCSVCRAWGEP